MFIIYAGLINQKNYNYQTLFSARFVKQDEDGQVLNEHHLNIILKN